MAHTLYKTTFQAWKVTGSDAIQFLQGQLSNDVNRNGINAYNTPKGEVLSIFVLFHYQNTIVLFSQDEKAADAIARLKLFVLRSDVSIQPVDYHLMLSSTEQANAIPLHPYFLTLSTEKTEALEDGTQMLMEAGLVKINAENTGKYPPQFLNLDYFQALDWKKGCYVGQELIARLYYRGRVSKRCFALIGDFSYELESNIILKNAKDKPIRSTVLQQGKKITLLLAQAQLHTQEITLSNQHYLLKKITTE